MMKPETLLHLEDLAQEAKRNVAEWLNAADDAVARGKDMEARGFLRIAADWKIKQIAFEQLAKETH